MSSPVISDGTKRWYQDGVQHRVDGPAIEYADGTYRWYLNGVRHREDGPAVEYLSGYKAWWHTGKRHRTDGPAVEYIDGDKESNEWWLNGIQYTEELFRLIQFNNKCKCK
jgi:hypothetical protein